MRSRIVLSLLVALALHAGCSSTDEVPASPDAGSVADAQADTGDGGQVALPCPAADYLAGKPLGAGKTVHESTVTADETWRAADSPHVLKPKTQVKGATLTIEPCAVVVASTGASLTMGDVTDTVPAGVLVAAGRADAPIVFTNETRTESDWDGLTFNRTTAASRLSHVTIEWAGRSGPVLFVSGLYGSKDGPVVDHSTLRQGSDFGIWLEYGATLGAGSTNNVITAMKKAPISADASSIHGILDGTYTGNADDRIWVRSPGKTIANVTMHALSVPWYLQSGLWFDESTLTIEAGTRVQSSPETTIEFGKGGSLQAKGTAAKPIILGAATAEGWNGLNFGYGRYGAGEKLGLSTMEYVTVENGHYDGATASGLCGGPTPNMGGVIVLMQDVLTMRNCTIKGTQANVFGVIRNYCTTTQGAPQYSKGSSSMNTFVGPMLCAESDQKPCAASSCSFVDPDCCDHAYQCAEKP